MTLKSNRKLFTYENKNHINCGRHFTEIESTAIRVSNELITIRFDKGGINGHVRGHHLLDNSTP
ncbi:CLUMA_CG008088, isoform A [Clunio marinus]|uniref:CLUMA_CG008088, isoform A n=1 Tax=Clunio marinus TaxID=568069 RepID=A0A1J1I4R7_9DIPT|nr:CLUMA_CG008088, isoform A [Clunio marinus]